MHKDNSFLKTRFISYFILVCLLIMQPQQADALFGRRLIPFLAGHMYGLYSMYILYITNGESQEKGDIQKEAKKGFMPFYLATVKNSEPIKSINELEAMKNFVENVKDKVRP